VTPEQREQQIEACERMAAMYFTKAEEAWWPGTKKDYRRSAVAALADAERLRSAPAEGGAA
jgi:hypothetical protein